MRATTIVHVATFLQGGAGRIITDLACAQRVRGQRVIVAATATPEPGFESYAEYLAQLDAAGVEIVLADSSFKRNTAQNDAMAAAICARLRGDVPAVIHAHAAVPAQIGRKIAHAPVVQTMHGWSLHKRPEQVAQDLAIMSSVDLVVFPSAAAARQLFERGAILARWVVVPAGIRRESPRVAVPLRLAAVLEHRRRGARVLATIGSLTPQKNHLVVIEALPRVLERFYAELVLVGEGEETERLRARAQALGVGHRVHFVGYLEGASAVLDIADVLVQPSLTESFGIAVLEAFRARVPVVASDIPALNELVRPSRTGWRFDAQRHDTLSAAVIRAFETSESERAKVLDRAEALFLERFTVERMVAGYDAAYAAVASERGKGFAGRRGAA